MNFFCPCLKGSIPSLKRELQVVQENNVIQLQFINNAFGAQEGVSKYFSSTLLTSVRENSLTLPSLSLDNPVEQTMDQEHSQTKLKAAKSSTTSNVILLTLDAKLELLEILKLAEARTIEHKRFIAVLNPDCSEEDMNKIRDGLKLAGDEQKKELIQITSERFYEANKNIEVELKFFFQVYPQTVSHSSLDESILTLSINLYKIKDLEEFNDLNTFKTILE